jgi:colanic acid biosynthesis glycosyl transferase WcaI
MEDLVLPSKLAAMLASGRPVVATARPNSDVARCASVGGLVVPPGDTAAFESAIRRLLADDGLRREFGATGRAFALANWEQEAVMRRAFAQIPVLASAAGLASDSPPLLSATEALVEADEQAVGR